ncbi:pentatricopeptide repeat-containing protein At3g56030, mitochondrial isoform X1 [Cryptomeria japonica]|uniref:pentatricopeptide repeat-containing protein At3g56030, mitochondrial isoform X1 n=1 Tax=Cryptomeria japonica TaxID=3369 RepID=UPI0027DA66E0|nr:pentatricopeptide repeat-containing protein At3g56030, mitochondrial isoform X1 [Cryptomeria japonica]
MAACHLWRRFLITQLRRQTCVSSSPIYKCKLSMHVKTSNHGKSFGPHFCGLIFYSTNPSPQETHENPDLQQQEQTLLKLEHFLKNIKQILPDSLVLNDLMEMCDKLELSHRNNAYDMLIKALCKENYVDLASDVLEKMFNVGCTPRILTFHPLISVYSENNQMDRLYALFDMMKSRGCPPDSVCYITALRKVCYRKRFAEASQLLESMVRDVSACKLDAVTYDLLIYAACKTGKFEDGLELLGRMKAEGIRPLSGTYTHILNGFVKGGEFDKAHLFLLQESGNNPSLDSSNYESLIRSCSSAGREKEAYELFMEMKFKGLELLDDQLCKEVLENHGVDEET